MNYHKWKIKIDRKIFFFIFVVSYLNLFAQTITKGPYLANPKETSIVIRWESDSQSSFVVKYGLDKQLSFVKKGRQIGTKENRYLYEALIIQLIHGKSYFYQIIADTLKSEISTFKCNLPKGNALTFVVTGDSRSRPEIFKVIAEKVNELNPDLIISVGDLVRNGGDYDQWNKYYFKIASNVINHIPFVPALGDHEADKIDGDDGKLFSYFFYPHKDQEKLWFSYNYGDAHFVVLDYRFPDSKEMVKWFKKDMSSTKSKWNFVYMHRPSYNLGGHRSAWGRTIWPKLFNEYKIDIVFAGHSHLYERFYPVRPKDNMSAHAVTYITTGGSGASLYKTGESPLLAFAQSIHHYIVVKINGEELELETYKTDGTILDKISWTKNSNSFKTLIKPQEELDIVSMLMSGISRQVERLPMKEIPSSIELELNPVFCKDDIHFKIYLTEESNKYYEMKMVSGVIKVGMPLTVILNIYAKGDMTVSKWGEITPVLQLKADYKTNLFKGTILGKEIEYRAY